MGFSWNIIGQENIINNLIDLRKKNALPNSNLIIIDNAGHSAFETGIKKALISALDDLRNQI